MKYKYISYILLSISFIAGAESREPQIADYGAAVDYCRTKPLKGPEGLWIFPDDLSKVMIIGEENNPYKFNIYVVESDDCRLKPGEKIGEMEQSAAKGKFTLSLFTSRNKNILTDMRRCLAEYNTGAGRILIHPRSVKFSLRNSLRTSLQPFDILPKFWLLFNAKVNDPAAALPTGLIRLYPNPADELIYY